jgi:hypothetical protein
MPFTNEIAGGQGTLVRNWLQSQNFVTGVSGWQIQKNGNAEFNNGTFRGSITSGSNPGQHVVINDAVNGYAVSVYNTLNQLVAYINDIGVIQTQDPTGVGSSVDMFGGSLTIAQGTDETIIADQEHTGTQGNATIITSFASGGASNGGLNVWSSGVGVGAQPPTVTAIERNTVGSIVVTDGLSTKNIFHAGIYSGQVAGGNGVWNFNHGASFTPTAVIMTPFDINGVQIDAYPVLGSNPVNSTQCTSQWWTGAGVRVANGVTVAVHAIFLG